ncbi:uncharacterized protein LOC114299606 [Camellia sinensis]|uniref:uncharacterized protein LOC114299606 n=1 Tax=Camellia sinensis TaxID=4442 RepID=UPI001036B412|nr:uncharacterized protein LOC114299606 [Camellia sinensis]
MVSQNVLATCNFDMLFTFINSGWEGRAHDNAILVDSITRADLQFSHPPNGKYYLVDAGFTNMPGFLAQFRSQRYHLQKFRGHRYVGPKELFNHRHPSLRNVIERTFVMDPFFMEADNKMAAEAEAKADGLLGDQPDYVDMSQHGLTSQSNVRDAIATAMWQNLVHHGH